MREIKRELLDLKKEMEPEFPKSAREGCFGFAFNDINFSDRVLRIEVITGPSGSLSGFPECAEEQVLNQSDADDVLGVDNDDKEAVAKIEGLPTGDEGTNKNDSPCIPDRTPVLRVQILHISSPILAAKSPFFYKLFSNGSTDSEQRYVTLRINESEEAALMELLNFMYCNSVSANTVSALLDVLMAADKYEVASCMRHCGHLLQHMPMTAMSALRYLDLPSTVSMAEAVQPLTGAAKKYLAHSFNNLTKFQEELISLPITGIEAVLSSDDLQVTCEDAVYDFVLKWAKAHYPNIEERREILATHVTRYIRFPHMTCRKLKKALTCPDFDHKISSNLIMEALFFKAEAPHRQRILVSEESATTNHRFTERAYKYRPVKVIEFDHPRQQCFVYLDLTRDECANLFPTGRIFSQAFELGGQGFFLSAHCNMDQHTSHCFGFFIGMQVKGTASYTIDYEFTARSKPTEEFQSRYKGNYIFRGGKAVGYKNLFDMPWTSFMADDSPYFINGVLHLRAELTIDNSH